MHVPQVGVHDVRRDLQPPGHATDLPAPITPADLNPHDPRIVRQVETYFRDHGIAGGKFSHYRPAAELLRQQATLIPRISAATLDKASLLFKRLNDLIR
jgi:hypothetical protein